MKSFIATHRFVVSVIILGLFFCAVGAPHAAYGQLRAATSMATSDPKAGGVGRQGNGQPLRVMVMMNGAPVAKASVIVSVGDGSVILRGVTKPNGTFTTMLDQGIYNVSASTPKGKATSPVTIVQSTDPAVVSLTLAP